MTDFQVAVIGGGPAGLAATLTLSRSMIRTVLFDDPGQPRNHASPDISAFPGSDRISPTAFRTAVAEEIDQYGYATRHSTRVTSIENSGNGAFRIKPSEGEAVNAQRILLATGMIDLFPEIDGLANLWGRSVINCPFCQGFEWRDRAWGVFAHRPEILAAAEIYRNWTSDLIMFVGPDIVWPEGRRQVLDRLGIQVVDEAIASVLSSNDTLSHVTTESGRKLERDVLLVWPKQAQCPLIKSLSLPLDEMGCVRVDDQFKTPLDGIFAAGDLIYAGHQNANTAIHMGNMAAANIVFELCMDG